MWINFFFFSGSQRAGILLLIFLFVLVGLVDNFLPVFFEYENEPPDNLFIAEINDFKKSLISVDSIRMAAYKQHYHSYYSQKRNFDSINKKETQLFPFNPNKLDSSGFVLLGLKPYIISNILKYRRKVQFKDKQSFAHIYGISEAKYKELADYIQLPEKEIIKNDTAGKETVKKVPGEFTKVDLNTADTTALMQIKGIGRSYARAIIRFRKQTGGFVSLDQLSEIYGMTPENLCKIRPFCFVNPQFVQKIKINIASVEKLKAHPYLNFYQAKQIYELRRKKGKLSGMADLVGLSELDEITIGKISAYLNFE
jgi:competence ComEA-like helix-hairpin-helix protein